MRTRPRCDDELRLAALAAGHSDAAMALAFSQNVERKRHSDPPYRLRHVRGAILCWHVLDRPDLFPTVFEYLRARVEIQAARRCIAASEAVIAIATIDAMTHVRLPHWSGLSGHSKLPTVRERAIECRIRAADFGALRSAAERHLACAIDAAADALRRAYAAWESSAPADRQTRTISTPGAVPSTGLQLSTRVHNYQDRPAMKINIPPAASRPALAALHAKYDQLLTERKRLNNLANDLFERIVNQSTLIAPLAPLDAAEKILRGEPLHRSAALDVAEQMHEARRKVEQLDRALNHLQQQIQHEESTASIALARELDPALTSIRARIRDAVIELLASTRALIDIEAEASAKGYTVAFHGHFEGYGITTSNFLDAAEAWLFDNWRDEALSRGLRRNSLVDAQTAAWMELEAEFQRQNQRAVMSGRRKQSWDEFVAKHRRAAA